MEVIYVLQLQMDRCCDLFCARTFKMERCFWFCCNCNGHQFIDFCSNSKKLRRYWDFTFIEFGQSKRKVYEYPTYIGSLAIIPVIILLVSNSGYTDLFMYIIGPCSLFYLLFEMRNFSASENKKLIAALVFIFFSIVFWAFSNKVEVH